MATLSNVFSGLDVDLHFLDTDNTQTLAAANTVSGVSEIGEIPNVRETVDWAVLGEADRNVLPTTFETREIEFTIAWEPADTNHAAIQTASNGTTVQNWAIRISDGTNGETFTFAAYVSKFNIAISPTDVTKAMVSLTIDGAVTRTVDA